MANTEKHDEAAIMRVFADADAIVPSRAKTAAELGLEQSNALQALTDRGMVRSPEGQQDRLYIPLLSRDLFTPPWLRRLTPILFVTFVIAIIALLVLKVLNPHMFPPPIRHF